MVKYPPSCQKPLNVVDLYDLMDWQNDCPKEQQIEVEPGFYHLTFSGEQPKFAVKEKLSDEEYDELLDKPSIIYIHINRLETVPESKWKGGVPFMYWAYEEEQLMGELAKGKKSGEEKGWLSSSDVRAHFRAKANEE